MSSGQIVQSTLVHRLATLLRNNGDSVLDGSSTLTLQVGCLQHLTQLFEQHLLTRSHQHGFLALPSHPADTASMLEVQFLFDMLQKTVSLKLVNPLGAKVQSAVKIFPFKSLRYLELKRIPPHCLEGLRGVYSQLEVFNWSKGLSSLEELLSLCGGDLSFALPWLELHTLNFSYNSISCLDKSLSLLNVLKWLDLSHNKIQDCAEFLVPLTELEHLNLSYNNLQRAPVLGLSAQAKLTTLVLRNNELETINGMEQLSALRCLDLAYNLLMEHAQLVSLSFLHNLNMLTLKGNPLYFQKTHRASTVRHLSPRAAFQGFQLDGTRLSPSDLVILPKPGQLTGQVSLPAQQVSMAPDRGGQELSTVGEDMTDSATASIPGVNLVRKRKHKNKVKVRRASISEPSDTDHELRGPSALQDIVLPHQKDINRMDSFREQLGEDWLSYQHHLDDTPVLPAFPRVDMVTFEGNANCYSTPPSPLLKNSMLLPPPLRSSEPRAEEDKEEMEGTDLQIETESTLQWTGHSPPNTESTLEMSLGLTQAPVEAHADPPPPEEEDDDRGVDLCRPMLVGLLSEDAETDGKSSSELLFLRVRQSYLLEVDMHQGRVTTRLELDGLREVITAQTVCTVKEVEGIHPVLELHFRYISCERRKRCYIMLDDEPQEALQVLAEVLSRVAEENELQVKEEKPEMVRLQCLKCQSEFCRPAAGSEISFNDLDEPRNDSCTLICSECNSNHVVQLAVQLAPSTSTPIHCPLDQNGDRYFTFDDRDTPVRPQHEASVPGQSLLSCNSPLHLTQSLEVSALQEGATAFFQTAHSVLSNSLTNQSEAWADQSTSQPISVDTTDGNMHGSSEGLKERVTGSSYHNRFHKHQYQQSPMRTEGSNYDQFDMLSEAVDHRLQLYLDMEVFKGEEVLRCFLKMSIVKFGDAVEFQSLMAVSNQHIYILEITSQSEGPLSDWLQKRESHRLCELSYLEVGLSSQTIHMEFDEGAAAYTLLVRNSTRCKWFFSKLTEIAKELAPKSNSKLKGISTMRLDQRHHLWHLVCDDAQPCGKEGNHPSFRYLLAFLQQDGFLDSVSVLATKEMLFLLDEDHQWSKSQPEGQTTSGKVTIQETQPISCVSSIHLFSSDPCRVDLKLYDEMAKKEKTLSLLAEDVELVQDLLDWIKHQWEAMFGVKLATVKQ
ncbi:serine/threonine-protein kinase 11-interacting protein isoform X1 [Myxocyprinus asiaticus]|uniref:serine/threonine-protein kinase 11-interacting protein isoform X1 n=2 Tax=Myxocyprinus asiaticus TaxID=70543 RepID=UPI0022215738|nr:serine/threonine-protein kinase 11-interacting protein isoform X1 [Myxocyprinus asiaticus]